MIATQVKDPDETRDFALDWTSRLANGETLVASTWTPQTGLTVAQGSFTGTIATARVTGGTVGNRYTLENEVTTSFGRTYHETLDIEVRSR